MFLFHTHSIKNARGLFGSQSRVIISLLFSSWFFSLPELPTLSLVSPGRGRLTHAIRYRLATRAEVVLACVVASWLRLRHIVVALQVVIIYVTRRVPLEGGWLGSAGEQDPLRATVHWLFFSEGTRSTTTNSRGVPRIKKNAGCLICERHDDIMTAFLDHNCNHGRCESNGNSALATCTHTLRFQVTEAKSLKILCHIVKHTDCDATSFHSDLCVWDNKPVSVLATTRPWGHPCLLLLY